MNAFTYSTVCIAAEFWELSAKVSQILRCTAFAPVAQMSTHRHGAKTLVLRSFLVRRAFLVFPVFGWKRNLEKLLALASLSTKLNTPRWGN